jgi:hypothetical protein
MPPVIAPIRWRSDIAFENVATIDGRFIVDGALNWRELPLTLMAMTVNSGEGHVGSFVAGRIDELGKDKKRDMNGVALADGAVAVRGAGIFDVAGENGAEVARLVEDETLRGISVDLAPNDFTFRDPETGELLDKDEMTEADWERAFFGELQIAFTDATVVAATVCPTPAFDHAHIALAASADGGKHVTITSSFEILTGSEVNGEGAASVGSAVVASAAPAKPRREWFETQEMPGPTPLTVSDEGRVFGHIALWDSCHVGFGDVCVHPPRSYSNYAYFHVGELETDDGSCVAVGKLMYGGPHAPITYSRTHAAAHYDRDTHVAAYLRATDGAHGIWVAGALHPDADAASVRANPPSGDWRPVNGRLELIAALAVPVPGFATPRAETAIVSSGEGIEVLALIVSSGAIESSVPVRRALVAAGLSNEPMPSRLSDDERIELLAAAAASDPIQALAAMADAG